MTTQGRTDAPVPASVTPIAPQAAPQTMCGIAGVTSPLATYRGLNAQKSELASQRSTLVERRDAWARRLQNGPERGSADEAGILERVKAIDAQLAVVDAAIAENNGKLACMAAVPGAVPGPAPRLPGDRNDDLAIAGLFLSALLAAPLVFAWSRRIWRRGTQLVPFMPRELEERLTRIEQTVESVAVEVERVGEGQRFVTNLFAQNGVPAIGAGGMEPVDVRQRERVAQERLDR